MHLGESYIEGKATLEDKEYTVNIQGSETGLVLPSDFKECDYAIIQIFTEKGNELKIETKVERNRDWIQLYDNFLTETISVDLPIAMTIECIDK